jgi:hypothetical protein
VRGDVWFCVCRGRSSIQQDASNESACITGQSCRIMLAPQHSEIKLNDDSKPFKACCNHAHHCSDCEIAADKPRR